MCGNFSRQDSAHLTIFNGVHFFVYFFPYLCFAVRSRNKEGGSPVWSGPAMFKLGLPTLSCFKDSPSLPTPSSPTSWPPPTVPSSRRAAFCHLNHNHHHCDVVDVFTFVVSTMAGSHLPLAAILFLFLLLNPMSSCPQTLPAVFLSSSILFRNFTVRLLDHLGCNWVIKDHRWWSK